MRRAPAGADAEDASAAAIGTAGKGSGETTGDVASNMDRRISLHLSVALAPQLGQSTGAGIRPLTGSISKLNFVPHSQRIFSSILRLARRESLRLGPFADRIMGQSAPK